MKFGSLFAGIGGLDLGLERAGMECIWQVENDPYATRVLEKHWPDVRRYGDIKEIDWSGVERPDLVCGGFPCQPFSFAGKQLGTADERWLWPEFANCLCVVRPRIALLENVPGLLTGGMGEVLGDLAAIGYDAEWESIPAAAVGAPHLRYRVFILGYANGGGKPVVSVNDEASGLQELVAYSRGKGLEGMYKKGWGEHLQPTERDIRAHWEAEPRLDRVGYGLPSQMDRLKCLGNAERCRTAGGGVDREADTRT
jgi:DNA (cytosine-5)-methyltransferase 1